MIVLAVISCYLAFTASAMDVFEYHGYPFPTLLRILAWPIQKFINAEIWLERRYTWL